MSSQLQTTIILALLLAQSSLLISIHNRYTILSKTSVSHQQKFIKFETLTRVTQTPSSTPARDFLEYTKNSAAVASPSAFVRVVRSLGKTGMQTTSVTNTCEQRLKLEYYKCVVRALSVMPAIAIRHAISSRMAVQRACLSKTLRNVECLIGPHREDNRAS